MKPRTYDTPLAFKAAVEQRLKNEAARTGMDLNRLRQLLVFDRFLARLFDLLEERLVLKGGLVLELRLQRARTTKDIDLGLKGRPEQTLEQLRQAGRLELGDHLSFEVQPDPHHHEIEAEALPYDGRRYRAEARLAGKIYGARFGVDVAFAEPAVGEPEIVPGSAFFSFAGIETPSFRIYPLPTQIAEKLHAYTLPRRRPNSRVKDLPDIALLATVREISADELRRAIEATFSTRGTHPVPSAVPDPPEGWAPVYERMARVDGLAWSDLDTLLAAVRVFLDPLLRGEAGQWIPDRWQWKVS